ncbi:MAG: hypothetical protein KAS32_03885, partial [Candidatus Peribacteraceae bacterium]|nr:hypothetical protein [Candidatus Peribacteraceae bacterium]
DLPKPSIGNVEILREPVAPFTLQKILISAAKKNKETNWIAVKNLEAVVNNINIPDDVRILYPPFLLLDPVSQEKFLSQDSFTYDEALLAVKLLWYKPHSSGQLTLHGAEQSVWSAKIACTDDSEAYKKQFDNLPSVILLDHRQLLSFLADPEHTAHGTLSEKSHIIIDDASMLEDTATRAYGWYCAIDTLRAGAKGNNELTGFTDILSLWIERTRNSQDIRYLTTPDLTHPDAISLRDRADDLLYQDNLSSSVKQIISHALSILNPDNLGGRIAFIEQRFNGSLILQSVPEYLGDFLQKTLYEKFCVSLVLPQAKNTRLAEILPKNVVQSPRNISSQNCPFSINIDESNSIKEIFENPPEGKTILLATSKRSIDEAFMRHSIPMEKRGVTLICQGFSGGINRTRAEFLESEGIVIWMLTPWAYEGVYLPENSADRLLFTGLPFDHPSHAILSKRAEHFRDPFNEYSLPRMLSRIFRLLRTFSFHCKKGAIAHFLDQRINTKRYGNDVKAYLNEIVSVTEEEVNDEEKQMKLL